MVIFGAGSAVAMTASSANELIFLRGLIGLGAALVMPATLSTITGTFPPAARTRAVSVWTAVAGGSALLGLLCTGALLEAFSWRSAFAINLALAVMAIAGTLRFVPESSDPDAPRLDTGGAFLALGGLTALVFSIIEAPETGWLAARTIGGICGGLAVLAVFTGWELRAGHPMLDPRHFRDRHLSAGSLSIFIQFFALFGVAFVMLEYLQGLFYPNGLRCGSRTCCRGMSHDLAAAGRMSCRCGITRIRCPARPTAGTKAQVTASSPR